MDPWSVDLKTIEFELIGGPEGTRFIGLWNGNTGPHFFEVFNSCRNYLTPKSDQSTGWPIVNHDNEPARVHTCDDYTNLFPAKPTSLCAGKA